MNYCDVSVMCLLAVSVHTASEVVVDYSNPDWIFVFMLWRITVCPADTGPPLLFHSFFSFFSPRTVFNYLEKVDLITERKHSPVTLPAPQPIDLNECWISIRHSFANDSWTTSGYYSLYSFVTDPSGRFLPCFFCFFPPSSSNGWVWGWTVSVQQQKVYTNHLEVRRWRRLFRQQWWRKLS